MSRRRNLRAVRPAGFRLLAAIATSSLAFAQSGVTTRVSRSTAGVEVDANCREALISTDGRFVTFSTAATTLVAGDGNGASDVFFHDRQTGSTTRISVSVAGAEGNDSSTASAISADGRYVGFVSRANNLVASDTNGSWDGFVRDTVSGTLERVTVGAGGVEGNASSNFLPFVSPDGRYVSFVSSASNLGPGDVNNVADVFLRDRVAGTTLRVSVDSTNAEGPSPSYGGACSTDARFVAFDTESQLVPEDDNGLEDVYVRDVSAGITTRVSVSSAGGQSNGWCGFPALSGDGRFVAFQSDATTLVPGDTNGQYDIFVHDRSTAETRRVSVSSTGAQAFGWSATPSMSVDGRYVLFSSYASNLVPADTNSAFDVFVHDLMSSATLRLSVSSSGIEGNGWSTGTVTMASDGRTFAFPSGASNLVANDTNAVNDIFVRVLDCWPSVAYCEAGLSTNYCSPSMSSIGVPASTQTSGFVLTAQGLEGQHNGLVFYGISGRQAAPFVIPGGSLLCVRPPVQRLPTSSSGGTSGHCDGTISIDWLAYLAAHPGALGQPFTQGMLVQAQCWYRDPPAPGGSNLSSAIEFELCD
jgi:Tol biopolymer transport system component